MEVRLRYRANGLSKVTYKLTYNAVGEHLHAGEFIRLQPDTNGEMVVVKIVKITHIKIVVQPTVKQVPDRDDVRLLVLVEPDWNNDANKPFVYSDKQLRNVGFMTV